MRAYGRNYSVKPPEAVSYEIRTLFAAIKDHEVDKSVNLSRSDECVAPKSFCVLLAASN